MDGMVRSMVWQEDPLGCKVSVQDWQEVVSAP